MKYFTLIYFLFAFSVGAQTTFEVVESETGGALPNAHIRISGKAQKKSLMLIANEDGKVAFKTNAELGSTLYIKVSYMGFTDYHDTITQGTHNKISMSPASENLEQLVVTGQYNETSSEKAIHKISVIDRKKIESLNAITLDEVLARELNMNIQKDNVLGSSISIQGLGGENVKILIDGVPIIGRLNGNIDISQINLANIERIEVVEGPLSVTYGSNALAGTINLITKKEQKKPLSLSANGYFENIGTANFDTRIGFNKRNYFGSASYTRNFFNGWNVADPTFNQPKPIADSSRVQLWKPRTQNQAHLQIGRKIKKGSIIYNVRGFDELIINRGYPFGPYNEQAFDDNYITKRLDNSLNAKFVVDSINSIQVLASYNYFERRKETNYMDLTGVSEELKSENSDTNKATQAMLRVTYAVDPIGKKWQYQLGLDLNDEAVTGKRILNSKQNIGDYAGFASLEYAINDKWTIRPGLRASYNKQYGAPVVPSLYAKYNLAPGHALRASVARGFRAPSVKELYMDFVDINHDIHGNPDLQAETALHTSINYSFTRIKRNRILKLKADLFYNLIRNKITLAQLGDIEFIYANVDEALSLGGNTEAQFGMGHLKASLGLSYTGTQNTITENNVKSDITFSPQLTSNITYAFKQSGVDLAFFLKYAGKVPQISAGIDGELIESFIDNYTLLDFTAKKSLWANKVSFGMGIKNILNVTNISVGSSGNAHGGSNGSRPIAPGRIYFVKLGLSL